MLTKRILVVDDERLARISLTDFLQDVGYETVAAGDGKSAISTGSAYSAMAPRTWS